MVNFSRGWIGAVMLGALLLAASSKALAERVQLAQCGIVNSSDWQAHVDAMPGPSGPRLVVSGAVGVKPASKTRLLLDPSVMESYPVQRTVILEVITPSEPTIDLLTRREVRGEWPVTPPIGAITVRCGRAVLARITDIVTAR